jgi:hypothetical protein
VSKYVSSREMNVEAAWGPPWEPCMRWNACSIFSMLFLMNVSSTNCCVTTTSTLSFSSRCISATSARGCVPVQSIPHPHGQLEPQEVTIVFCISGLRSDLHSAVLNIGWQFGRFVSSQVNAFGSIIAAIPWTSTLRAFCG